MRVSWATGSLLAILLAPTCALGSPLSGDHRRWIEEEVRYVVSEQERTQFLALETEADRDEFIRRFWDIRDPDPTTEINEYREEHYLRIDYADRHFSEGIPGRLTDRGRIYIMHGPPSDVQYTFGGDGLRVEVEQATEVITGSVKRDTRLTTVEFVRPETEIWLYRHIPGSRHSTSYFEVMFSRIDGNRLYEIHQMMNRLIGNDYLVRIARDNVIMNFLNSQRIAGGPFRILYAGDYRYADIDSLYQTVFNPKRALDFSVPDLMASLADLERSPGDVFMENLERGARLRSDVRAAIVFNQFTMTVTAGSLRAAGGSGTMVPVTLGLDPGLGGDQLELLVELVRPDGTTAASVVDSVPIGRPENGANTPFLYQTRLVASPGGYRLRAYGRLEARQSAALEEVPIVLPDFNLTTLAMSDILLFDQVIERTQSKIAAGRFLGQSTPVLLKDHALIPASDRNFRRAERLTAVFEVYNPGIREDRTPDLDLHCRLWKNGSMLVEIPVSELDYLTDSRVRDDKTLQTTYGLSFPLRTLPPGVYDLEFEVFDRILEQPVSRRTQFRIQ